MNEKQRLIMLDVANEMADEWGPEDDPCRDQFIQGFKECVERKGEGPTPPEGMEERCAYYSGWIGARDEFLSLG